MLETTQEGKKFSKEKRRLLRLKNIMEEKRTVFREQKLEKRNETSKL